MPLLPITLLEAACTTAWLMLLVWYLLRTCPACCIRCIDIHVAAESMLHILQVIVSGTVNQQLNQLCVQSLRLHWSLAWCTCIRVIHYLAGHIPGEIVYLCWYSRPVRCRYSHNDPGKLGFRKFGKGRELQLFVLFAILMQAVVHCISELGCKIPTQDVGV